MAFASYVHDKVKFNYKYLWVWPDGILSKYILKKNKIPGRLILSNLRNEKSIKNIYLISSKNKKNINYLKDKFRNKKFTFINAPKFFENYFESIWRLQNDTFRRSIRLISSLAIVIKRICFRELTEI